MIERRFTPSVEVRVIGDETPTITGYSAVFGKDSVNLGGFIERIAPGAFARALREKQDIRALVNHDSGRILGRLSAGTLRLMEDTTGLLAGIDPPDTQVGRDIVTSIKRGDVTGQSFSFRTVEDQWEFKDDGPDLRTLIDVDLFDVGPVTFPAYPDTTADARSLEMLAETHKAARIAWEASRRGRIFRLTQLRSTM